MFNYLKLKPDRSTRPYNAIDLLKKFRDSLAHGKPNESEFEEVIEVPNDGQEWPMELDRDWVDYCKHDTVFNTYDDLDTIW